MTRFALVLLASCVPLSTSSTTTSSTSPRPTGQQAPAADERAAMYEPVPFTKEPPAPLDATPRPCVAAQNHCMRGGWFLSETSVGTGPVHAVPAYPKSETEWVDYRGAKVLDAFGGDWGHAFRTAPAKLDTLKLYRPAMVFCPKGDAWPKSEAEMLTSADWYLIAVEQIDRAAGTISIGVDQRGICPTAVPISNVRAIVEFRNTH